MLVLPPCTKHPINVDPLPFRAFFLTWPTSLVKPLLNEHYYQMKISCLPGPVNHVRSTTIDNKSCDMITTCLDRSRTHFENEMLVYMERHHISGRFGRTDTFLGNFHANRLSDLITMTSQPQRARALHSINVIITPGAFE
jgi:hypothetical protein